MPCEYGTGIDTPAFSINFCQVFPNPFHTNFTIKIIHDVLLNKTQLKIIDVSGREVKTIFLSDYETIIERNKLDAGIYFYNVINNNELIGNGKLLVQ